MLRAALLSVCVSALVVGCVPEEVDGPGQVPPDTGLSPADSGATSEDGGPRVDSGATPVDSGAGGDDAGGGDRDAGGEDAAPGDTGVADTGVEPGDAGPDDAGVAPDTGVADTGVEPDAGFADTGVVADAGFPDSGVTPDAGFPDSGVTPDAGFPDSGVTPDAGFPDSGVTPDAGFMDSGVAAVFSGELYANTNLAGAPFATRQDAVIDYNWGAGPPQAGAPSDNFSIRWTATIRPTTTETYTFITDSDDGVRFYVDGVRIIDNWSPHSLARDTATRALVAGQTYTVTLEYYDSGFDAVIRLLWSSASVSERPVVPDGVVVYDGGVADSGVGLDGGTGGGPSSSRQTARPLGSTGAGNGYYEYLPPSYSPTGGAFPLMVFWHGVGENGNGGSDLFRVLTHGPPFLIANDNWPNSRPFVVLSPQHSGGGCPTSTEIRNFIAYGIANYNIDPNRVYLTGLSCGAIGSWNYLGNFTDTQVAAAVLIAGNGNGAFNNAGCNLGRVAIWGFHGLADTVVAPSGTTQAMNNIIACPNRDDARLNTFPGVGHESWIQVYDLTSGHDIYTWFLQQTR